MSENKIVLILKACYVRIGDSTEYNNLESQGFRFRSCSNGYLMTNATNKDREFVVDSTYLFVKLPEEGKEDKKYEYVTCNLTKDMLSEYELDYNQSDDGIEYKFVIPDEIKEHE